MNNNTFPTRSVTASQIAARLLRRFDVISRVLVCTPNHRTSARCANRLAAINHTLGLLSR